jgi:hypothetical protein
MLGPFKLPYNQSGQVVVPLGREERARGPDAAGAGTRCVVMTLRNWRKWDYFSDACWTVGDVGMHPPGVVEGVMYALVKGNTSI